MRIKKTYNTYAVNSDVAGIVDRNPKVKLFALMRQNSRKKISEAFIFVKM